MYGIVSMLERALLSILIEGLGSEFLANRFPTESVRSFEVALHSSNTRASWLKTLAMIRRHLVVVPSKDAKCTRTRVTIWVEDLIQCVFFRACGRSGRSAIYAPHQAGPKLGHLVPTAPSTQTSRSVRGSELAELGLGPAR